MSNLAFVGVFASNLDGARLLTKFLATCEPVGMLMVSREWFLRQNENMNLPERMALDELIDHCGTLPAAIDMLRERIARRAGQWKKSPIAESQLTELTRLWESSGGTYQTRREMERTQKGPWKDVS